MRWGSGVPAGGRARALTSSVVGDARRAEQVDLDGAVEGGVEAHRRGGSGRRCRSSASARRPSSSRPSPSSPTSPAIVVQPPGDLLVEAVAELAAQPVEAVVAEDLARGALGRRWPSARADEHDDLAVGHAAQQALDERRAEEARRAGDGDAPAGELVGDHDAGRGPCRAQQRGARPPLAGPPGTAPGRPRALYEAGDGPPADSAVIACGPGWPAHPRGPGRASAACSAPTGRGPPPWSLSRRLPHRFRPAWRRPGRGAACA